MDYEKKDFRKLYEDLVKSDWFKRAYHNKSLGEYPFDIPELSETEDERIRKEISTLYADIDSCISELLAARINKDAEAEGKALFRMEGLMVATLQDLSCVEDWLEKQGEQKQKMDE